MFEVEEGLTAPIKLLKSVSQKLLDSSEFILLVGSFAEGLATSTSDIDIYVCCKCEFAGDLYNWDEIRHLGHKLEISIIQVDFVESVIRKASQEAYDGYSLRDVEIIHKIIKGKVLSGSHAYNNIVTGGLRESFNKKVVKYFQDFSQNHYEDFIGSYEEDDRPSACNFLRSLVDSAIDVWLAANQDTYPKVKWRIKRAYSKLPIKLYEEYLNVVFCNPLGCDSDYKKYITRCLLLYRKLCFEAASSSAEYTDLQHPKDTIINLYAASPMVLAFNHNDINYIKIAKKQYKVNYLSQLIVWYLFKPRSLLSILMMAQANGYHDHTTIKAISNLNSTGVIYEHCQCESTRCAK